LGSSRYVPWQRIRSWTCIRCGGCCRRFKITITPYEYARLSHCSEGLVSIDDASNPILRKIGGRCVAQDGYGLCALQRLGMKPIACKVWPFTIFSNPKHRSYEALFIHEGKEYSVYVDRAYPCAGMNRGNPEALLPTIEEMAEIYQGRCVPQLLSTSSLGPSFASYDSVRRQLTLGNRELDVGASSIKDPRRRAGGNKMVGVVCRPVGLDRRPEDGERSAVHELSTLGRPEYESGTRSMLESRHFRLDGNLTRETDCET